MLPKRPRLKAFDYLGPFRYFLTFCTANRHDAFIRRDVVDLALSQILRAAGDHGFSIIAYCFMPDHLHLLVEGQHAASDLREFCRTAKQFAGFAYKGRTGRHLWQPSYFEHVLRDEEDTWSVARYIIENPLAEGLAARVRDYPFVGSCVVGLDDLILAASAARPWESRRRLS